MGKMRIVLLMLVSVNKALYECDNGDQIITENDLKCDGNVDCRDASDEMFCLTCSDEQFNCFVDNAFQCIHHSLRCDGFQTCDDGWDELNCPQVCQGPHYYSCPETLCCIDAADVCTVDNYCDCTHGDADYDYGVYESQSIKKGSVSELCATWSLSAYQNIFKGESSSGMSRTVAQISLFVAIVINVLL